MKPVALVVPTLGSERLAACLQAATSCDPAPLRIVVVHSGGVKAPQVASGVEVISRTRRLGFAAAVNTGIDHTISDSWATAILNDDAEPSPGWLQALMSALEDEPRLAATQGTVAQVGTDSIDGRGIEFDRLGLPIQVDRARLCDPEPSQPQPLLAVSGTAALYRNEALREIRLPNGDVFDSRFGSYHEDLDVGLRLRRLGWNSGWTPNAHCLHTGSASAPSMRWRHPWWVMANRWRALAGNLTIPAILALLPTLMRGELRAVRTLARSNPRALPIGVAVAVLLPWLVYGGRRRLSPGPRLDGLPRGAA